MSRTAQRLDWLDLFRGLAVLGMIWTHSANTFLDAALQQTAWFHELTYYHGLIAPAFFWIAGFARAHVTTETRKPALPALKRLLLVLLTGYLLHVPWDRLLDTQAVLRAVIAVDVLHCLALTGMLLLVLERCGRWREAAALVLMLLFVSLEGPAREWSTGVRALDAWWSPAHGSVFTLFPWAGFGLAGFATRRIWNGGVNRRALVTAGTGALLAFAQPVFFLERLGWVMLAAVVVAMLAENVARFTGWLRLAGRESLLLYVVHLLIIHSIPLPRLPLQHLIGPTQPPEMVACIFTILFGLSLALGIWNERRKRAARERRLTGTQ